MLDVRVSFCRPPLPRPRSPYKTTAVTFATALRACYRLEAIEGKGLGVVATRDIKQGELVCRDQPLLRIACEDLEELSEEDLSDILEALPKKKQE